jgi:hypothetical protein
MDVRLLCSFCVLYVAASVTSWSLVQRSPTCCVYLIAYGLETLTMRRPMPEFECCVAQDNMYTKYTSKIIHIIIRRPILTHFHFAYWVLSCRYAVIILWKLLAPQNILLRPGDYQIRFQNVSWLIDHEHPPQLAHFRLSQLVNAVYNYHYLTLPTPEISAVG